MSATNHIDEELKKKADQYINTVANEVADLIKERFKDYYGAHPSTKDLEMFTGQDINNVHKDYFKVSLSGSKSLNVAFQKTFTKSFKDEIVKKMTQELLNKIEFF